MANVIQVKEKVAQIIRSSFGDFTEDSEGRFLFPYKQTQLFFEVKAWREMVIVQISAPVVFDIEFSEELSLELLLSTDVVFGDWTVIMGDEQKNKGLLLLSHTLVGDELDAVELMIPSALLANSAATHADALIAKYGGMDFSNT